MEQKNERELISCNTISYLNFQVLNLNICPAHTHKNYEVISILEGFLHVSVDADQYTMQPGDLLVINPNAVHSCSAGSLGAQMIVLQFDSTFCKDYYPKIANLSLCSRDIMQLPHHILTGIDDSVFNIGYNYIVRNPGFEFRCLGHLNRLMSYLVGYLPYRLLSNEELTAKKSNEYRVQRILNYVQDHFTEKIRLQDIATRLGLTASYLSHFFKDNLHQSFQSYLNNLRLEKATYLLIKTDQNLIDICMESGFSDPKYFNKAFLNAYQMKPKEFRDLHLNRSESPLRNASDSLKIQEQPNHPHRIQTVLSDKEALQILKKYHKFTFDDIPPKYKRHSLSCPEDSL